jgi:hypothetical protein
MACRNICEQYRAIRWHDRSGYTDDGRYEIGQKRCQICDIFIGWEGYRCPCCNTALRTRPRPKKCRERLILHIRSER